MTARTELKDTLVTITPPPRQDRSPGDSTGSVIIGESAPMLAVMKSADRVADSRIAVLIQGERGTGKKLLARFLHERSRRSEGPLVAVNCAAVPQPLLEGELFGHEGGAVSGAVLPRPGAFERAHGGTILLEEVAGASLPLQGKILRVIKDREVERLGGDAAIPVDVRVIASTDRMLEDEVADGRFREDLYYHLAVVVLTLPPLRERGDDIRMLAEYCVTKAAREHGRTVSAVSQDTLRLMRGYSWPGNVRELCDVLADSLPLADGPVLLPRHLPLDVRFPAPPSFVRAAADRPELVATGRAGEALLPLAELERRHIRRALSLTGGHLAQAAQSLGIHRNTLRRKLHEYGIEGAGGDAWQAGGEAGAASGV